MATFKPIAINRTGVNLPYAEGQYIVATQPFTDGSTIYQPGVYVDMLGGRQQLTMTGPQGPKGEDGTTGATGAPGQAATLQIGRVTTGAPGSLAQVSNSGTEQNAVINFVIPTGADGPRGQQGAGWFHTMAPSGVTLQVSSLQPQLTPSVGDVVFFSNGEVRQIITVSGSTVTLGDVLFSFKGDPGIGNATLSGVYGNSTENGYTQEAANGVVQAKNYYNEAYYDTSVSNGDGTANVDRKTDIIDVSTLLNTTWQKFTNQGLSIFVYNNRGGNYTSCKCNRFTALSSTVWGTEGCVSVQLTSSGTVRIDISYAGDISLEDFKKDIYSHPTYIQYELPPEYQYADSVIENQPISFLPLSGEIDLYKEWRKGLNSAQTKISSIELKNGSVLMGIAEVTPGRTYTISFNGNKTGDNAVTGNGGWLIIESDTPALTTYEWATNFNSAFFRNEYLTADISIQRTVGKKYLLVVCGGSGAYTATYTVNNLMINEGAHPYPYEPYYGAIVRQKDLSGIQLFPEGVNPAETIGGDWEDEGTVTTSNSIVLHAYRRLS